MAAPDPSYPDGSIRLKSLSSNPNLYPANPSVNHRIKAILRPLASLKLTVVLFAAAMFLIFAGTLAQVHQGIWTVMTQYFRSFMVWIDLQLFIPRDIAEIQLQVPFPGGFVVGGLLLTNLIAAHAVRFKFTRKRIGIITLHLGVILLLVGELVTALYADEGNMTIDEGSFAHFTEDIREAEFAVIDPSNPDHDQVAVVPESMMAGKESSISDPQLPFDITVNQWMPNSQLFGPVNAPPGVTPKTTHGLGRRIVAQNTPRATGVEGQTIDLPSAYVTLSRDGTDLGTWLVSLYLEDPQPVSVAGKTYGIALRFKRNYKPYTMHLIDFKHDKFIGTDKARNFSSLVRLVDPTNNEDRQVLIWMNHPLRYAGETFYQSAFKPGDTGTILQVVRNPGWLLPYVSCILVSVGMLIHFGMTLFNFVRRARA